MTVASSITRRWRRCGCGGSSRGPGGCRGGRSGERVAGGVPAVQVGAGLAALGLHRRTIYTWLATERTEGHQALRARPVPGRPRKLAEQQLGELAGLITESDPRDHRFAVALWTREVIRQLIAARFGVQLTVASVGRT